MDHGDKNGEDVTMQGADTTETPAMHNDEAASETSTAEEAATTPLPTAEEATTAPLPTAEEAETPPLSEEEEPVTAPLPRVKAAVTPPPGKAEASAQVDAPEADEPGPDADAPVAPGVRIGPYVIERVLSSEREERTYLATEQDAGTVVALIERPSGAFAGATAVVALGLRHPRLLAPRAIYTSGAHDFLAVETLAAGGTMPQSVSGGGRLDALPALSAGLGLADALSYLHRNGLAHLHVSPEVVFVQNGRAFLGGMESAEYIGTNADETAPLVARDANFLARTLGPLAGLSDQAPEGETGPRAALRQIVAQGAAGAFITPEEVMVACGTALQEAGQELPILSTEAGQTRVALAIGSATTVGRVRSENQDASAVTLIDVRDDVANEQPFSIFLVADGMGGEAHGEIASRLAARIVCAEMVHRFAVPATLAPALAVTEDGDEPEPQAPRDELARALAHAVNEANRAIRGFAEHLQQTTGTTLTAIATSGARAALAHVGDSRAYLLRGNVLAQLTEDHSVLARLQAMDHPILSDPDAFVPRNMLYRSLGQEEEFTPDLLDFTLVEGDRLLLCSDGLWDEVTGPAIARVLAEASDPRTCAEQLVALANEAGGHDNSTAVVAFVRAAAALDDEAFSEHAALPDDAADVYDGEEQPS